ncbi:DnaJ family domain-containing protein [Streptomyces halobius]|uniref:DUF1992 domain-containing protein n=1 Tax=Streptomyces halobius TaxID=2879846 RepID=A0ABY4M3U6_9ACTN|nr:DUF1992 domain-containing protein [Streptomyces halobius]UQA91858.1 DUF1992 domain-containing protein [Streptomyces halobius]
MTERKPPGVSFESWVDKQIREATERGDFDRLSGAGKPLPHLDQPYDEMWWIKDKMSREHLSCLPPTLALRKEAEEALEAASNAPSEAALRRILTAVNERIDAALRTELDGPPLNLTPFDIDEVARNWRARHGS